MERGNFVPVELTTGAGNTYSISRNNNMAENTGEIVQPNTKAVVSAHTQRRAEDPLRSDRAMELRGLLADPKLPTDLKGIVARELAGMLAPVAGRSPDDPNPDEPITAARPTDPTERLITAVEGLTSKLDASGRRRGGREEDEETAPTLIDPATFTDPEIKKIASEIRAAAEAGTILRDRPFIEELEERARAKMTDPSARAEVAIVAERLKQLKDQTVEYVEDVRKGTERTLSLTLTQNDFTRLRKDPISWLREKLDRIYELSVEGQELDSQQLRNAQSLQEAASRYMASANTSSEVIRKFDEEFLTKLNVMYARATIQQRNMEGIVGMSTRLTSHGLLNTLTFEEGKVGRMHNRIQELYDDVRVKSREHHITPEEHSKIQRRVIEEYVALAESDDEFVSSITKDQPMSRDRRKEAIRAAVTRSVRTGYDHFVASQREAVIVARGEALPTDKDLEGIIADPSGLFQMFNYEQMLVTKFSLLSEEQIAFFDGLKRRFAEATLLKNNKGIDIDSWARGRVEIDPGLAEKEITRKVQKNGRTEEIKVKVLRTPEEIREAALVEYGKSLMKDLLGVNDFYSNGWKVAPFMDQIDDIFRYKRAEQIYAAAHPDRYKELREIINKKDTSSEYLKIKIEAQREYSTSVGSAMEGLDSKQISEAEDQAKNFGLFMRLRAIHTGQLDKDGKLGAKEDTWQRIARYRPEDVVKLFRSKDAEGELGEVNAAFSKMGLTAEDGMTLYDSFKDEYGAALRMVREKGFANKENGIDSPEQIDFSQILSNPGYGKYKDLLVRAIAKSDDPVAISSAETKVGQIAKVFGVMKGFAGNEETIGKLMNDVRFEDVYNRTYAVDDVLLDRMESVDQGAGLVQISRILSSEAGGDAYRRAFNDATNAVDAHTQFLTFLRAEGAEEKLKAALGAAEAASHYAGTDARAKIFRYTYGSYMIMGAIAGEDKGKLHTLYEVLDWKILPFRKPINELQKIFGPQAPAFNNDEMLHFLDEHRSDLSGVHGEEMWQEMRRLAKTRALDRFKFTLYRGLIYSLIWLAYESIYIPSKTVEEGLESEELK